MIFSYDPSGTRPATPLIREEMPMKKLTQKNEIEKKLTKKSLKTGLRAGYSVPLYSGSISGIRQEMLNN